MLGKWMRFEERAMQIGRRSLHRWIQAYGECGKLIVGLGKDDNSFYKTMGNFTEVYGEDGHIVLTYL